LLWEAWICDNSKLSQSIQTLKKMVSEGTMKRNADSFSTSEDTIFSIFREIHCVDKS